jgi:hypothetical protein
LSPAPGPPQGAPATEATRAALVAEARRRLVAYLEHEAARPDESLDPSTIGEVRSLVSGPVPNDEVARRRRSTTPRA